MELVSLKRAREENLLFYFTNKYCKNHHISKRYTRDRTCFECCKEKRNTKEYKERASKRASAWRNRNIGYYKIYYETNREKELSRTKDKYERTKEKVLRRQKQYRKDNPEKVKYSSSIQRASKLNRTPSWANLNLIKEIYRNCPKGYHVDHIVPLRGKNVSGLHIPENLQYLTIRENLSKGNKF